MERPSFSQSFQTPASHHYFGGSGGSISSPVSGDKLVNSVLSSSNGSDEIVCVDKFIGDEQIFSVTNRLKHASMRHKKKLALRGNCIGSAGAKAIADLLRENASLESISLEWNQVGAVGCAQIAEGLKFNNALTHLDLRNNGVTDEGAAALGAALESNNTLRVVDLRWNQITDIGAENFQDAIVRGVSVLLAGNNLSSAALLRLEEWASLQSAPRTPFLSLPPPPVVDRSSDDLLQAKVQNSLLANDIKALRTQLHTLQTSNQSLETQLGNCALRIAELEQTVLREETKNVHLQEAFADAQEKLAKLTQEHGRLVSSWEIERNELVTAKRELVRERDAEVRALTMERDSAKEISRKSEESHERSLHQLQLLLDQSDREKIDLAEDLRQTLSKLNDASIQESKLKADNVSLRTVTSRLNERIAQLETELKQHEKRFEEEMSQEKRRQEREQEKMRSEFQTQRSIMEERVLKLTGEVSSLKELRVVLANLQSMLVERETLFSHKLLDVEKEHEEELQIARANEKSRYEAAISDLKHRLELMTSARRENEDRCSQLVQEIKALSHDHAASVAELQSHLNHLEEELRRSRSQVSQSKDALSHSEAELKVRTVELEEGRKKVHEAEETKKTIQRALQETTLEKQAFKEQLVQLQQSLHGMQVKRRQEFSSIEQGIRDTLVQEFENLKVRLQIFEQ